MHIQGGKGREATGVFFAYYTFMNMVKGTGTGQEIFSQTRFSFSFVDIIEIVIGQEMQ
jgi:hypothetical protein